MRTTIPLALVLAAGLLSASSAMAGPAGRPSIMLHPTQIQFEGRVRGATLHLVNRGDAAGVFVVEWIDYRMTEAGGLERVENPAWSVREHVRLSPSRVTLEPGGHQVVKLALRPQPGVTPGEYRSHLRVMSLPVEEAAPDWSARAADGTSVSIRPRAAMAVPVTWRNLAGEPEAELGAVRLAPEGLEVEVLRRGELSLRGRLRVVGPGQQGEAGASVAATVPVVIYPELAGRTVAIPFERGAAERPLPPGSRVELVAEPDAAGRSRVIASRPVT